jgi:hypothetical protein
MSGKIGISVDSAGRVTMQFLTCSATLPDKKGLFFMSPSCGSGKSTIIAKLAAKAKGGVLIVVPTIDAANNMRSMVVNAGRKGSEIRVLTSQDFSIMDTYRDNPMAFTDVPVLIITSARIQIDPIQPFITFKGGQREMILIDELINFYPDPFEIPSELQDILTYIDSHKSHGGKPAIDDVTIDKKKYYRHIYGRIEEMETAVWVARKRLKNDILKGKGGLNSFKRKTIFEHILKNGFVPIQKKIVDLAADAIVIVFDGTADIIIPKSDHHLIPITGTRYSSDIQFGRFEFGMKRNNNEYWQESDIQKMAPEFIKLAVSLSQSEKILVICWKTIRLDTKNTGNADTLENPDLGVLGFPEILRRVLVDAGGKDENIFITYRGSGHDRGSNEYVECSSVLFLGEWRLPAEPITGQISRMFGFKMRFWNYKKSLLVQTICRSRIRQHKGLPVKVWFSSDIDYQMAWEVQEYFKVNSNPGCKISGIIKPFRKMSKPMKSHLYQITRLYSYDPRIRSSIESGSAYCFSIDLDGLDRFVHLKYKKRNHYRYLQKALKEFGITMTIL